MPDFIWAALLFIAILTAGNFGNNWSLFFREDKPFSIAGQFNALVCLVLFLVSIITPIDALMNYILSLI